MSLLTPFSRVIADGKANSPDGKSVHPSFGNLFTNEVLPINGRVDLGDEPGFGLELNPNAELVPYGHFWKPSHGLGAAGEAEEDNEEKNKA